MLHIQAMENKSHGIKKKIFDTLETLKLGRYYYECAIILFHSMLRSSILYSIETYFNMNEKEIRAIERIEEDFLRTLVGTKLGCPISQLYFDLGVYPARFEAMKRKILYYHHIVNQNEKSLVYRILAAQKSSSVKGDWIVGLQEDLKYLEINIQDIHFRSIRKNKLIHILKNQINQKAFKYLTALRKSKGKEILYTKLEMASYLKPQKNV